MGDRNDFSDFSSAMLSSKDGAKLSKCARESVNNPLPYQWTPTEEFVLDKFFTNKVGRVSLMVGMSSRLCGIFFSLCATIKNKRGMRGVFVDKFFPLLLAPCLDECNQAFAKNSEAFLTANGIDTLDKFIGHSSEAKSAYNAFVNSIGDPRFLTRLSANANLQDTISNYRNNMGLFLICFDGVSLLTAQAIQSLKPFFGSDQPDMLLSNFFPGKEGSYYSIENELELLGIDKKKVQEVLEKSFDLYYKWRGKNNDGPLIKFFMEMYQKYMDKEELVRGAIGEACNVLAAFVPTCLYTSFGIPVWQNEFPAFLRSLLAKDSVTPESAALVDLLAIETGKVNYDISEHLDSSPWSQFDQKSMEIDEVLHTDDFIWKSEDLIRFLDYYGAPQNTSQWFKVLEYLSKERFQHESLPTIFKNVKVGFRRRVSFRAFCGIQKAPFSWIKRSKLSPKRGFFSYDKPLPEELLADFQKIHTADQELNVAMEKADISPNLRQYVMAMGNQVQCYVSASLYLWEKIIYENTRFDVPHEVRKFFMGCAHNLLHTSYPFLKDLFRRDETQQYIFHSTAKPIEMPVNLKLT